MGFSVNNMTRQTDAEAMVVMLRKALVAASAGAVHDSYCELTCAALAQRAAGPCNCALKEVEAALLASEESASDAAEILRLKTELKLVTDKYDNLKAYLSMYRELDKQLLEKEGRLLHEQFRAWKYKHLNDESADALAERDEALAACTALEARYQQLVDKLAAVVTEANVGEHAWDCPAHNNADKLSECDCGHPELKPLTLRANEVLTLVSHARK